MAGTKFTVPTNLVPKVWAAKVWREGTKASYFDKFTATDGSKPIYVNKDLTRAKGDTVYFGIAMNLAGAGVTGNATLVGNEDELKLHDFAVTTQLVRNAVSRYVGDDNKSPYQALPLIKETLVQWLADWKDDTLVAALTADPTTGEFVSAASAGTEAAITASNKLTCDLISKAKRKAMLHAPKVKPIKVNGQDRYIMLVSPLAARDLKSDAVWQAAQQNANVRGDQNPIFTGALGVYDGVILYEYERIKVTTTGASSANVCHNLLLGQQAACYAVTKQPYHIQQLDDYGNVEGNGIAFNAGIAKVVFDGHDYGQIQVMTGGAAD